MEDMVMRGADFSLPPHDECSRYAAVLRARRRDS
jgi:hypothetical protein